MHTMSVTSTKQTPHNERGKLEATTTHEHEADITYECDGREANTTPEYDKHYTNQIRGVKPFIPPCAK